MYDSVSFTLESLEADPFTISFKAHSHTYSKAESLLHRSLHDTVTVEMKDGTRYQTWGIPTGVNTIGADPTVTEYHYWLMTEGDDSTLVSIDPADIAAVYLGATKLFG